MKQFDDCHRNFQSPPGSRSVVSLSRDFDKKVIKPADSPGADLLIDTVDPILIYISDDLSLNS
jgi:hypothetical protein